MTCLFYANSGNLGKSTGYKQLIKLHHLSDMFSFHSVEWLWRNLSLRGGGGRFASPSQVTCMASCGVSSGRGGVWVESSGPPPPHRCGVRRGVRRRAWRDGGPTARLPCSHGVCSISLALLGATAESASVCPGPFIVP